jgi:tetratricopeptide (TPR) repeat protein
MGDAEGALEVLGRDMGRDPTLAAELAKAYLAIGQAKGPYSAVGSEGDPAAAAPYVRKSLEIYRKLSQTSPSNLSLTTGKLDALAAWLHLQYRLDDGKEGRRAAAELLAEVQALTPALRARVEPQRYRSTAYLELGIIQSGEEQNAEAVASHRLAVSTFLDHIPPGWLADPARLEHLAHANRELAVTLLMNEGSGPEAEDAARRAAEAVAHCAEPPCRMRHAQSLGTLGEIEFASGETKEGTADLRRGLAEFEALAAEDPANAVFSNAAAQLRDYLALALRGSPEALALARKNVRVAAGADRELTRGRERLAVHGIVLGATLAAAGRYADAEDELRSVLSQIGKWNVNADLTWSACHELALAYEAQGDFAQQFAAARQAWDATRDIDTKAIAGRIQHSLAARDLASAAAHWPAATSVDRAQARQLLDQWCTGLAPRRGTLVGALIAAPPDPAEVATLRKLLGG